MTSIRGNAKLSSDINTELVLKTIMEHGPLSRAQVARRTGLTKTTVSSIVNRLLSDDFLVEIGHDDENRPGPKGILLAPNPQARFFLGASLATESIGINLVILDFLGRIVARAHRAYAGADLATELGILCDLILEILTQYQIPQERVLSLGMGVHGIIEPKQQRVLFAPHFPSWKMQSLTETLRQSFIFPITVDNDCRARAVAESSYGSGRGATDLIYLHVDEGIGAGIISQGTVLRGARHFAGEIGHMVVQPGGELCRCGNRGCLEALVSTTRLTKRHQKCRSFSELVQRFLAQEDLACSVVDEACRFLAIAIGNLINFIDPQLVVIGGQFRLLGEPVLDRLNHLVSRLMLPINNREVAIRFAALDYYSSAYGAALIAREQEVYSLELSSFVIQT